MITLHNQSCLALLPELKDKSIDLILIDPPYFISRKSGFAYSGPNTTAQCAAKFGGYKTDFGDWDKTEPDLITLLSHFYRILKNG